MNSTAILATLFLGVQVSLLGAGPPPGIKSPNGKTTQPGLGDEFIRARYIMYLARLRFDLIRQHQESWRWEAIDQEIIRHPAPPNTATLSRLRLGVWHSSRHDYLYKADGTWRMIDDAESTVHGTWSIKGAKYTEAVSDDDVSPSSYTVIFADQENFIYSDGIHLFFEKRTLGKGLPLRGDGT